MRGPAGTRALPPGSAPGFLPATVAAGDDTDLALPIRLRRAGSRFVGGGIRRNVTADADKGHFYPIMLGESGWLLTRRIQALMRPPVAGLTF